MSASWPWDTSGVRTKGHACLLQKLLEGSDIHTLVLAALLVIVHQDPFLKAVEEASGNKNGMGGDPIADFAIVGAPVGES
ncbi:hypothetical protein BDV41DRAFT_527431 [Aspergillus transmontanensis]|uniref:Uncharacterized protein n=1 Tax=Aspergillus transmontanensis TaxID=1034304 RepID=A0A5N6W8F5_9EURO|nr:hypothetical protein BDV41DRAFT_527431 [Aspergillus transmontanensis]